MSPTDDLPGSHYNGPSSPVDTIQRSHHGASLSELQSNHQSSHENIQSDQQQRAAALGPPGAPQGVKCGSEIQMDDRLDKLEKKLEELSRMLDVVKAQVMITPEIYIS